MAISTFDVPHPLALPDPLRCEDGENVTTPQLWRDKRRPEILRCFESEVFGKTLLGKPQNLKFVVREEKPDARGGKATRLRVGVLFEGTEAGRQMELLIYLPNQVAGAAPLFLGLNFDGNTDTTTEPDIPLPKHWIAGFSQPENDQRAHDEWRGLHETSFPYDLILERGYGVATAGYGEIEADEPGHRQDGPRGLAREPGESEPGESDWGAIGAWAWALSRALDYLQTHPRVDASKVALFGFSRLGKTALWAAAQDERFALVVSQNSGKAGASLFRTGNGEPVAHLAGPVLRHWFAPRFAEYSANEALPPVDAHQLLALIAPRPLLILSAEEDSWSDPEGEFLSALNADPVYRLLSGDGLSAQTWPSPQTLVSSRIGYYLRPGGHDVKLDDWQATLFFADKHLR